ncbi:hypothetical protein BVY00_00570 [bacterium G20]|nr:hypothetical protein BVY00_00570 [bacterium G20]
MKKQFKAETVDIVLGKIRTDLKDTHGNQFGIIAKRTPLHVDYGPGPGFVPSRIAETIVDEYEFNAVGSKVSRRDGLLEETHLPVLDIDGGAKVQTVGIGSKALIGALHLYPDEARKYAGKYGPASLLRDVLGDNGIDLEVFESGVTSYSRTMQRTNFHGSRVVALALRTKAPDTFVAVDSTQEGHSHLYIQQPFGAEDHKTLIGELGNVGVIGEEWQQLTEREGMGIVRTPWTERKRFHKRSSARHKKS